MSIDPDHSVPPNRRPLRRISRRTRLSLMLSGAAVLVAGGYTAAVALVPLPAPTVALDVEASEEFAIAPETAQSVVDAEALPSAVGWLQSDGTWANTDVPQPIASISKLATVLVCLEQQPLEAGAEGSIHVWTEEDAAQQRDYLSRDGIAFPIPVGTEVTQRQMLTLALLPSANDFAHAYAMSVFGDNATFVAAVDKWAARNGLTSLQLVEPTGMDESNVATAADVVRLGRLALEHPTVAELTRLPSAELPWGIGTVENTNPLLDRLPGMLGLKTGRSSSAGYNLVAAQETDAAGRSVTKLAVTLGRDSPEERINSSSRLLASLEALPQETPLVEEGARIGTATTVDGATVPLVAAGTARTVLLPGETAHRTASLSTVSPSAEGQTAGSITINAPTGDETVSIVTAEAIVPPDFGWRFTHPAAVFGWS